MAVKQYATETNLKSFKILEDSENMSYQKKKMTLRDEIIQTGI